MSREEARTLELACDKLLSDATEENCEVSQALAGHLRIQFGENNMTISRHDLKTPEWIHYQGDYSHLVDFIGNVQDAIMINKTMFEKLMWSYSHYRELEE